MSVTIVSTPPKLAQATTADKAAVVEVACAAVDEDELVQSMEEQAIHFAVPLHRPFIPLVKQEVPAGAYGHVGENT